MRISSESISIIKKVTKTLYPDESIMLFGSRADDRKKGGDIDLFIKAKKQYSLQNKLNFLAKLEKKDIKRKVDLVIENPNSEEKLIYQTVKKHGIKL